MLWLTFRQFRFQAVVAALALAVLTVVVAIVGSQVLADYHAAVSACARAPGCSGAADFVAKYQALGQWLSALVLVVPGLIGVFWGAPLLARELEGGTFRLAWTQSISRVRWTLCKLGLLGLCAMAVAGLCSLLVTWWSSPLDLAVGVGPFAHFDARGIVPVGYAAFAFALGMAAGAVIRQTVAAMGVTLILFAGVRVAFTEWVRPHLVAPLVRRVPFTITTPRRVEIGAHLPQGAWVVSESLVNRAGQDVGGPAQLFSAGFSVGSAGVNIPGAGSCPNLRLSGAQLGTTQASSSLVARCIDQLHLTNVFAYQPADRYWPFQAYETVAFCAAALVVGAFTVWWVRHRVG